MHWLEPATLREALRVLGLGMVGVLATVAVMMAGVYALRWLFPTRAAERREDTRRAGEP